jgi:hypothetical protein
MVSEVAPEGEKEEWIKGKVRGAVTAPEFGKFVGGICKYGEGIRAAWRRNLSGEKRQKREGSSGFIVAGSLRPSGNGRERGSGGRGGFIP